ncbi:MAG TPA: hypothetical protein VKL21_01665 [Candidatus Methanoperedens sp.]|nr:hypothetical protein [Candidatus Methanoperedens sp.]
MVNKMSLKQGIKNLLKNPFVFGASAGMLVVLFNISIASLAEGSLEQGYQVSGFLNGSQEFAGDGFWNLEI